MHRDKGTGLAPWPERLTTPPPRLAELDISTDTFEKDMVLQVTFLVYLNVIDSGVLACLSIHFQTLIDK